MSIIDAGPASLSTAEKTALAALAGVTGVTGAGTKVVVLPADLGLTAAPGAQATGKFSMTLPDGTVVYVLATTEGL